MTVIKEPGHIIGPERCPRGNKYVWQAKVKAQDGGWLYFFGNNSDDVVARAMLRSIEVKNETVQV